MDNRIVEFEVVVFILTLTFDVNSMVRMQFHRILTSNYALALNAHLYDVSFGCCSKSS